MAVYLNNRFLENENALLHVSDLSMQRGYAIFDFFRTVNGIPLFLPDHLDRFFASAGAMYLPVKQSREELASIIIELIKRTPIPEAGIRMMLTGGYSADHFQPAEPNLLITCNPIRMFDRSDFEKGFSIITYEHQRNLPHIKSINYQMGVWLLPELKKQQADEVLYYNNNIITEFPRSNIFIVTPQNKLVTPKRNMLMGVTRKHVLTLAADILPAEERDISLDELLQSREVMLTSTTKRIVPVLKINNRHIGDGKPGKITTILYEKLIAAEAALGVH
ncbi:MAG: aminotransferase class IV family protein [Chitinophagaceae bacterium]|nr:aminotransferase class IV family protein [Chitinophagaceae bacterium]